MIREEIRSSREKRPADFGLRNALAGYVRRRWPHLTIAAVSAEWGLTEGQARGVVYATPGHGVIDEIIKHKRGGWPLLLELAAEVIGTRLETHLEAERVQHERIAAQSARTLQALRGLCERDPGSDGLGALDSVDPVQRDRVGAGEHRRIARKAGASGAGSAA